MLFELKSNKSLAEIGKALEESAARHQFGVVAVHDLKATMAKKGIDYDGDCVIYEVCNPHQAKKVLEANGAISVALPCRISVYRSGGEFRIATLLPTELLGLFRSPELDPVAKEVEQVMVAMMRDAA
ncbi:MAG: DUF302 domain-containing protein [Bryobacterales bacterium]|nr:DUF302 domain-containing protein [Bryobacterales bacterium]